MDQFLFITKTSRALLSKMFKVKNSLAPETVNDLFDNDTENHYNLRHHTETGYLSLIQFIMVAKVNNI